MDETSGYSNFIDLLEKVITPGWWDKETHRITYHIVHDLLKYADESDMSKKVSVKEALLALNSNFLLPSSMFNLEKKSG